jgi:hypothetical protein
MQAGRLFLCLSVAVVVGNFRRSTEPIKLLSMSSPDSPVMSAASSSSSRNRDDGEDSFVFPPLLKPQHAVSYHDNGTASNTTSPEPTDEMKY